MKSRAIVFDRPGHVEMRDVEIAQPGRGDIVVETEVTGVSVGTERWAYLGKRAEISFPNVPGYMGVGRVMEAGEDAVARGWKPGDRAYFFASRFGAEFEGKSWMGSHLSHGVIGVCGPRGNGELDIHNCERVPESLASEDAALLGLCGVAMRGIEMAGIPAGASVLVCGLGAIGQFAAQVCALKGAIVTVTDVAPARLEIAVACGADFSIDGKKENVAEAARRIAPAGYDVIIDTSSVAEVVNSLFPLLRLRGKFVFQGWYPPPTPLNLDALHQRLPSVFFPCAHSGEAVATALRWAAAGRISPRSLITHRFKPSQAGEAYEMIAKGSEDFLGVVFDWRTT